jgi:hypothetical protein
MELILCDSLTRGLHGGRGSAPLVDPPLPMLVALETVLCMTK